MYTELDRLAQLEYAREEGEKKGREKGREEGREEGREKGREEGREEGSNARSEEIARKMKAAGADPAFIKEMTGVDLANTEVS